MNKSESIEKTKKCFEESFRSGSFYNKQTRDEKHFHIKVRQGMKILDLGTGTGYLSFPFAERYKQVEIVGLDIVEETLEKNR